MKKIEKKINKDLVLREKLALQRTVMANTTTLLAFLRTSLYFLVAGLSVTNLLKIDDGLLIEWGFFSTALLILGVGIINFFRNKALIKKSEIHVGDYKLEYLEK